MTPAAPTDVAPISDPRLERLRDFVKTRPRQVTLSAKTTHALLARLDEAEAENEHLIQQTVRFIELEAERDRLTAANTELVAALKAMVCGTRDAKSVERARALVAKHGGGA